MSEGPKKPVYSATRRLHLKTKMLKKATSMLVAEEVERKRARASTLDERVPPLKLTGMALEQLQELCKDLIRKSDEADDARYDMEVKVQKNDKEIQALAAKVFEMKGAKRPNLKRVKKAKQDEITVPEVSSKADFKMNLKTVKKAEEKKEEVTDWRKNVEAMSGMDGRKKMFNAGN